MDYLWSPWRYRYVTTATSVPTDSASCLFCRVAAEGRDADNLIVHRAERNFMVLNRYPYTSGHLMIAPYEHVNSLESADPGTLQELILLARRAETALRNIYKPDGLNLGFNIGEAAGAGIAGHVHMHVLPRWYGDTSFITSISETRVLPESLEDTYARIAQAFRS